MPGLNVVMQRFYHQSSDILLQWMVSLNSLRLQMVETLHGSHRKGLMHMISRFQEDGAGCGIVSLVHWKKLMLGLLYRKMK